MIYVSRICLDNEETETHFVLQYSSFYYKPLKIFEKY